jgi:chemotaxis protein CheX
MTRYTIPTAADLSSIVGQIWASYLDPESKSPVVPAQSPHTTAEIVASVSISGSWHGHVVVSCSAGAARAAAAAFLLVKPDEVAIVDVVDVMGELANIVGGNLKSMLPATSFVSLPQVVSAAGTTVHWPACEQVCEFSGTWQNEPISISMWQKTGDSASAGWPAK